MVRAIVYGFVRTLRLGFEVTLSIMAKTINNHSNNNYYYCYNYAEQPNAPMDIRITNMEHFLSPLTSWATVTLQWDQADGRIDSYSVNTTGGYIISISNLKEHIVTITNVTYNEEILISIVAINCNCIKSEVTTFSFNISKFCSRCCLHV